MIIINDIILALRIIDVLKSGRNSPLFTLILYIFILWDFMYKIFSIRKNKYSLGGDYVANHIENLVEKLTAELLVDTNIELVDVEYVKERDWYLRVFIDKVGGIEIEDCQSLSEQLESRLDELDPISESYYLEVSSPGIDRVLKKDRDLERHKGDMIEISTFAPIDGSKVIIGKLTSFTNIDLIIDDSKVIPRDKIAKIKLYVEF